MHAQTTVTVVAQLPKMEVRLDTPQTSAGVPGEDSVGNPRGPSGDHAGSPRGQEKAPEGPQTVAAFKGQILHWRLYCVSSGCTPAQAMLHQASGVECDSHPAWSWLRSTR